MGISIGFSITGAFDIPYYFIFRFLHDLMSGVKVQSEKKASMKNKGIQVKSMNEINKDKINKTNLSSIYSKKEKKIFKVNISQFNIFKKEKNMEPFPYFE